MCKINWNFRTLFSPTSIDFCFSIISVAFLLHRFNVKRIMHQCSFGDLEHGLGNASIECIVFCSFCISHDISLKMLKLPNFEITIRLIGSLAFFSFLFKDLFYLGWWSVAKINRKRKSQGEQNEHASKQGCQNEMLFIGMYVCVNCLELVSRLKLRRKKRTRRRRERKKNTKILVSGKKREREKTHREKREREKNIHIDDKENKN